VVRNESSRDVTRTTLAVLFIGILIGASGWILHPFLTALVWATMLVVATWPLMLALQERLWGKRALAVTVMTVALLLVFIIPFTIAVLSLLERTDDIAGWVKSLATLTLPPAPAWVVQSGVAEAIARPMFENWLLVLGAFMLCSWGATHVAHRVQSTQAQYAALAAFVVMEALIFAPLLYVASAYQSGIIDSAAGVTLLGSAGLIARAGAGVDGPT
jgi:hypothetical protein